MKLESEKINAKHLSNRREKALLLAMKFNLKNID